MTRHRRFRSAPLVRAQRQFIDETTEYGYRKRFVNVEAYDISRWSGIGAGLCREDDLKKTKSRLKAVMGPVGDSISLETLPAPDTARWTVRRKAEVLMAIAGGLLTISQARKRYNLSIDELAAWRDAVERSGLMGLRATKPESAKPLTDTA